MNEEHDNLFHAITIKNERREKLKGKLEKRITSIFEKLPFKSKSQVEKDIDKSPKNTVVAPLRKTSSGHKIANCEIELTEGSESWWVRF